MSLEWNGRAVRRDVFRACVKGLNETMGRAVVQAKKRPRMPVITGKAQGSIRIVQLARVEGTHIRGKWGSTDVLYFVGIEAKSGPLRGGGAEAYPEFVPRVRAHLKRTLR